VPSRSFGYTPPLSADVIDVGGARIGAAIVVEPSADDGERSGDGDGPAEKIGSCRVARRQLGDLRPGRAAVEALEDVRRTRTEAGIVVIEDSADDGSSSGDGDGISKWLYFTLGASQQRLWEEEMASLRAKP